MAGEDIGELKNALETRWGISISGGENDAFAQLKEYLVLAVLPLLRDNPERLFQTMYRLDVREDLFHEAIASGTEKEKAEKIAEVILNRELQRMAFRKKYKQEG